MKTPPIVEKITGILASRGFQVMLVGGAVIDTIAGRTIKDWDLEIHGASLETLEDILSPFNPAECGKAFGILKLDADKTEGVDLDISVTRRDNKTGKGHREFRTVFDPNMSVDDAARRRDFTINAISINMVTGELMDPFGGLQDLEAGILRATDPETFVEDPLRVLRGMQLLARKAKSIDPETMELMRGIIDEFPTLAPERVFEEFNKLLLKAPKPSMGLQFLRDVGWIKHFPELEALIGCEQNPEWHPEGDVWNHTLAVVDAAAALRDTVDPEWREAFMFGALCHDLGKPSTTTEELKSPGHDKAGEPLAEAFMGRMTLDKTLTNKVLALVGNHMAPFGLTFGKAKAGAWRRLHNKIRLDVLGKMSMADSAGCGFGRDPHKIDIPAATCFKWFKNVGGENTGGEKIKPKLLGRHLLAVGFKPGPHIGTMLRAAFDLQLDDDELTTEDLLKAVVSDNA